MVSYLTVMMSDTGPTSHMGGPFLPDSTNCGHSSSSGSLSSAIQEQSQAEAFPAEKVFPAEVVSSSQSTAMSMQSAPLDVGVASFGSSRAVAASAQVPGDVSDLSSLDSLGAADLDKEGISAAKGANKAAPTGLGRRFFASRRRALPHAVSQAAQSCKQESRNALKTRLNGLADGRRVVRGNAG